MVKRLLDKGLYDFLEFKFEVNDRGHGVIHMIGIGKSQENDVEFEIKVTTSVIKGWPEIRDVPEPSKFEEPSKRGPGRPAKTVENE